MATDTLSRLPSRHLWWYQIHRDFHTYGYGRQESVPGDRLRCGWGHLHRLGSHLHGDAHD